MNTRYIPLMTLAVLGLAGCSASMPALQNTTAPAADATIPAPPAPAPVTLDSNSSALLVLDMNVSSCTPRPPCMGTVSAVASLIKKARDSKVPVIHSTYGTPNGPAPTIKELPPQAGEPTVNASADKFIGTNLEDLLKQRKATTLVIVGTAANGAVLYTAFHANVLGYTVVVADDGISSTAPIQTALARYQVLNQAGYPNAANKPLAARAVTLSRGDLITFK